MFKMNCEQSKICIVTTRNIFDSPCLAKYQSLIDTPFDIIYWDRCGIEEECGAANYFRYRNVIPMSAGKAKKLQAYFGFIRYVNRILNKSSYSKLIVFPTQAGWLIQGKLCRKYKGRYVLDIRDYAGENNPLIGHMTKRIVKNAGLCSITSPAYRKFLPEREYLISHNVQLISDELIRKYRTRKHTPGTPIVLSFIGSVRFIEQQKKLIMLFRNDPRFHLKYIGRGSEQLKDFCENNNVNNVTLIGRFERERLPDFYMDADMAINVYGNHDPYLDYALSNKLYSAAMMGMPILVSPETYMAELITKYGLGKEFNINSISSVDDVAAYFVNLEQDKLIAGDDCFLNGVSMDEEKYVVMLKEFIEIK